MSLKRRIENGTTTVRDSHTLNIILFFILIGGILIGTMIGSFIF